MSRVTGKATIVINGQILKTESGASLQTGGITREEVISDQGTVDYREVNIASEISGSVIHDAGTSLDAIRQSTGIPVNFETDSGVVYTISNAFCKSVGNLSAGRFEVMFAGPPAIEQLP